MMKGMRFNIYSKLLGLFLLLSLLPLFFQGLISYYSTRQFLEKNIGYKLEELARLATERVEQQMAQYSQQIQTWADLEVMQDVLTSDADGRINTTLTNLKKSNPVYHQISCLNQKGEIIASSELELLGKTRAEAKWFKQVIAGQTHISKLKRLKNGNGLGIIFSAPIQTMGNQKRVLGIFSAVLDWKSIYPMLESIRIEKTAEKQLKDAHIMIINQDGLVIFAPQWERRILNNVLKQVTFPQGIPGAAGKSQTGYIIQLDEHNQLSLIGYARSISYGNHSGPGWITLALQNVEQAFAPVYKLRNFIFVSFALLVLVVILIAHLFARQLTVPIKSLTQATRRIAQQVKQADSVLAESIQVKSSDELGELAGAFNLMSDELALAKRELEEKNRRLAETNEDMEYTIKEIQGLLENAVEKQSFKVRFHNPALGKCWETKNCNNPKCPSYKAGNLRCWHVAGTFCKGEVQGTFAKKLGDCQECEVYKKSVSTKFYAIGEVFNNMMAMLEEKNEELKDYAHNLENRVKKRTAELEQTNQELKQAQEQIIQAGKMAAIGQLAAGVSHELNNPLGGILGYSQFVLQMRKGQDLKGITQDRLEKIFTYVGYIERESQRCKTIVANLLKFSRSSKTDIVPLDINQVLEETFVFTQHQLDMNQVELISELAPKLPQVVGNEHQLQQVFTNLIVNAQQAMKKGGKLTVSTTVHNGSLEIAFADTGCGIPKKYRNKLFDPFFTTKEIGEGTGLGLSVSYGIIQNLRGSIEVESKVGKGTTFRIKLPMSG